MNLKLLISRRRVQDVKLSEKDYNQSKTGKAYKVFKVIDGKLYPPMVENPDGSDTPIGVWLEAESGEFVELDGVKRVLQRGANKEKLLQRIANLDNLEGEERKKEFKRIKGRTLAYRAGWHLGDEPRAAQFDREFSWEVIDEPTDLSVVSKKIGTYKTFTNTYATLDNLGKIFYVQDIDAYIQIVNDKEPYFPYDFVWAECDYVADIDYQEEAMSYGYSVNKKGVKTFRHALAGLPKVPEGGFYRYRTNPKPETVAWVITGAIKVNKLLSDSEINKLLGGNAPERQGGNLTLEEMGLK